MKQKIQDFQVGLKAFIEHDNKVLVLRESNGGLWEVPGGRIDVGEEQVAIPDILQREIREELGDDFRVNIGQPFYSWVRSGLFPPRTFIYLVGFKCLYQGGTANISDEHSEIRWIRQDELDTLEFAPGFKLALQQYWKS